MPAPGAPVAVPPASFAHALRQHRLARGLTQEELAERAGLSVRAVSDLERGVKRAPRPASVRLLAAALELAPAPAAALAAAARPAPVPPGGPAGPRHNLPRQLTSFVGREGELAAVGARLADPAAPLLTLTGPGGVGKTRLALRAAADALDRFRDGVWLVDLAPVADPALVPYAVARTLGVQEAAGRPLGESLGNSLRDRRLLLVLDNCEHLLLACARLAGALLRAGPGVPAAGHQPGVAGRRGRVGVARATAARAPAAGLRPPRSPGRSYPLARRRGPRAVRRGGPLRRPGAGGPTGLRPHRRERLGGGRGVPPAGRAAPGPGAGRGACPSAPATATAGPPGRSLPSADRRRPCCSPRGSRPSGRRWSGATPCSPSRSGACSRASPSSPGGGRWRRRRRSGRATASGRPTSSTCLPGWSTSRWWWRTRRPAARARFRLLETVRAFAQERLAAEGELEATRHAHAAYALALAEQAAPELFGPAATVRLDRLEAEHDNLRAALRWALDHARGATALRLGGALWQFWYLRGNLGEGRRWLEAGLSTVGFRERAAAAAQTRAGRAGRGARQGAVRRRRARPLPGRLRAGGDALRREPLAGAPARRPSGRRRRAQRAGGRGPHRRGLHHGPDDVRGGHRDPAGTGRPPGPGGLASVSGDVAVVAGRRCGGPAPDRARPGVGPGAGGSSGTRRARWGPWPTSATKRASTPAAELYQEALHLDTQLGSRRGVARAVWGLGRAAAGRGDLGEAYARFQEGGALFYELGDRLSLCQCVDGLAALALALDRPHLAARLLGAGGRPARGHRHGAKDARAPGARADRGAGAGRAGRRGVRGGLDRRPGAHARTRHRRSQRLARRAAERRRRPRLPPCPTRRSPL